MMPINILRLRSPNVLDPYPNSIEPPTPTNFNSAATAHLINIPASNAGDRLRVFGAFPSSTVAISGTFPPTGWTARINQATTGCRLFMFEQTSAGGAATTVGVTTASALKGVAFCSRIAAGTFDPAEATDFATANGTTATPDPPNISLAAGWGTNATLFEAVFAGINPGTVSIYPFPDGNGLLSNTGSTATEVQIARCYSKQVANSLNPGAYTRSTSARWIAATLATKKA